MECAASRRARQGCHRRRDPGDSGQEHALQREGRRVVLKSLGKRPHVCEGLRREPRAPWIPGGELLRLRSPGPKPALEFGYPPSFAELQWDGWRIRLSAVEHSTDVFKSLEETGGYAFTHMGRLDRTDGSHFAAHDAEGVLDALNRFLGFARGAASNLAIRWGVDASGATVWERWSSPVVDPLEGPPQLVRRTPRQSSLRDLPGLRCGPGRSRTLGGVESRAALVQKSNTRAGGMEGAIILGLTSLDLLGALVVVDKTGTMGAEVRQPEGRREATDGSW